MKCNVFARLIVAGLSILLVAPTGARAQTVAPKPSPEQMKQIGAFVSSLATQAAIYAAPLVAMYLLRNSVAFGMEPKAKPGEIWRQKDI